MSKELNNCDNLIKVYTVNLQLHKREFYPAFKLFLFYYISFKNRFTFLNKQRQNILSYSLRI